MTTVSQLSAVLGDRYRIERELGVGGMATVFLATDLKHDRPVAVKVLRADLAAVLGTERFLQEIRIAARLDHPHILTLIDSGAAGGLLYYVLPYVRGESVREKLERERQLGIDDALAIARQVGSALEYAHRQGLVHRDIKPENILLQEGEAMLTDFGIALAVREAGGNRLTETGTSLGTPQYMSPEQAAGDRTLDARSDEYSLAAVVYEMLAGEPPHTGATVQAVIAKVLMEPPTGLRVLRPTVPEGVDRAVTTALAKVPADRFASVGAFITALGKDSATGGRARVAGRWRAAAGTLLALGIVAALGVWLGRRPASVPPAATPASYDRIQVTTSGHARSPILSPDGAQIAYLDQTCADNGICRTSVKVRDLASGAERSVVDDMGWGILRAFSPDGSWLLIDGVSIAPGQPAGQYVVPRLGGPLVFVGAGRGDFLPTGDTVLIASATASKRMVQFREVAIPVTQPADSAAKRSHGALGEIDDARVAPNGQWVAILWERYAMTAVVGLYDRHGVLRDTATVPPTAPFTLVWAPGSRAVLTYIRSKTGDGALLRIAVEPSGTLGVRDTLIVAPGERGLSAFALQSAGPGLVYRVSQAGENVLWTMAQQAGKPPRPVRRVRSASAPLSASMVKDGRTLVFGADVPGSGAPRVQLFAEPFDSGSARTLTPPLPGVVGWSTTLDGRRLVVQTVEAGGRSRLTAYDLASARASPFAEVPANSTLRESTADGIAVLDPGTSTLRLLDRSGHERKRIAIPDSLGFVYAWVASPAADAFAFLAIRPDTESGETASRQAIYRVSGATGQIQLITWFEFGTPLIDPLQWSTDGSIYFGALGPTGNRPMLWRVAASGGVAKPVSDLPFAPDRCFCVMSSDGRRWAGVVSHEVSDIYLIRNFDVGKR